MGEIEIAMGIPRGEALDRINRFARQIERHLTKWEERPGDISSAHWRHEVQNWIAQVEALTRHLGKKTGAEWRERIEGWARRLGE